jgi:hypothetical protein
MVPNPPGEVPRTATGRPPKTRAMSDDGRLSQSMAFLDTPGMPLLYSGVNSIRPSAPTMRSLSATTACGSPSSRSTSPS